MGVHEYAAIVGQNVNVRSRPNLNAPIITSSHTILSNLIKVQTLTVKVG
jgi:hypothetical protein